MLNNSFTRLIDTFIESLDSYLSLPENLRSNEIISAWGRWVVFLLSEHLSRNHKLVKQFIGLMHENSYSSLIDARNILLQAKCIPEQSHCINCSQD